MYSMSLNNTCLLSMSSGFYTFVYSDLDADSKHYLKTFCTWVYIYIL